MQIAVEHASFSYRTQTPVLVDVNFTVDSNEILTILGANGAGKTTLLKCLLGFLKWTSGRTLVNGVDIAQIPAKTLWSQIGYVAQAKVPTYSLTIEEMVLLGRSVMVGDFAQPGKEDLVIVHRMLTRVGIDHLADRLVNEVSGGQYQLALIARALVAKPKLLVLDEPESNLDYKNQLTVLELLTDLSEKEGVGSIINTHYPAHALEIGDKALVMMPGHSPVFGKAQDVINEENLTRSFGVAVSILDEEVAGRTGYKSVVAHR